MTDFGAAMHRLLTSQGESAEQIEEIKAGILRLGGIETPDVEALRATVRDEVADAYQIPAGLRAAWDAIKEEEA